MTRLRLALAVLVAVTLLQSPSLQTTVAAQAPATVDPSYLNLLRWRSIGPARGGRVVAVAGDPVNKFTFYQGTTGGGVWKTEDGGLNWANISDGFFKAGSVGAIQVAPSNPNVVYVGMGEGCIRGNASYGDGVYKSTDAGKTWTHMGLEATRQTGRLQIHPTNPDIVWVASLGDAWGPSPDRGVFKTSDGGKTWKKVLFKSENAGAIDLVLDPANPNVIPGASAAPGPAPRSTSRPMAARRGSTSVPRPDCPRATRAASAWRWPRRSPIACGPSSTRPAPRRASIAPTTAARPGSSSPTTPT
jgi:hypothetical protein